jgi:hypothetical protein
MLFRFRRQGRRNDLGVGSRVLVVQDPQFGPGSWPSQPTGRIVAFPTGEAFLEVGTRQGLERSSWVAFDEPQRDADGDGPYRESQVLERHLRPVP